MDLQGTRETPSPERGFIIDHAAFGQVVLAAGLYVVATPIGHLRDISLRALDTLASVAAIFCEDTRVSVKLMQRYGIQTPLHSYHDHNAPHMRPKILGLLADGQPVALISDAGTPLVSDPGYRLVQEVQTAGFAVHAIPGASSVMAALVSSGLPTDCFFFEGFLSAKHEARMARLGQLAHIPSSLIFFEAGVRLGERLTEMAHVFGLREGAVCRELTKLHEEVRRGTLDQLAEFYTASPAKGEIVIVVAPPFQERVEDAELEGMLRQALLRSSVKDAVAEVATVSGRSRKEVYRLALSLEADS